MLAISSMTFSICRTQRMPPLARRYGIRANWILLAGRMTARIQLCRAGRATVAIAKEIDNESERTKLLHERWFCQKREAAIFIEQLRKFEGKT